MTDPDVREDDLHVTGSRVLVLNKARASREGTDLGAVVTIRDRTDLEELTGELGATRSLAEALRSQAHQSGNRLHTMVSLIELGHPERAVEFATGELERAQHLTDRVVEGSSSSSPPGCAGRPGSPGRATSSPSSATWSATPWRRCCPGRRGRRVELAAHDLGDRVELVVADSGPGIPVAVRDRVLERGFSTEAGDGTGLGRGIGLALVHETVQRLGGTLVIGDPPGATVTVVLPLVEEGS